MTTKPISKIAPSPAPPCAPLPAVLASCAGFLLNRSANRIREVIDEALRPLEIDPRLFGLLATLATEGPLTQQAIGAMVKVDRTTMVGLIDAAERKGLIVRGPHPSDRRCHLLKLSAKGGRVHDKARGLVDNAENRFFGVLTPGEQAQLKELLSKLFQAMPSQADEQAPTDFKG